jgi:two-component system capsular synthesis response regulator RcsB
MNGDQNIKNCPRVVLADDHPISRYGIRVALEYEKVAHVVAEAGSADELFAVLQTIPCDLIVTDYAMPDEGHTDGLAMIYRLANLYPHLPVVIITAIGNVGLLEAALRAGVRGWVEKGECCSQLAAAIREACAGRSYVSRSLQAIRRERDQRIGMGTTELTAAEIRVLNLAVHESLTASQIAERLGCSYKVVSRHKRSALAKLGLKSDQELYEYSRWMDLAGH